MQVGDAVEDDARHDENSTERSRRPRRWAPAKGSGTFVPCAAADACTTSASAPNTPAHQHACSSTTDTITIHRDTGEISANSPSTPPRTTNAADQPRGPKLGTPRKGGMPTGYTFTTRMTRDIRSRCLESSQCGAEGTRTPDPLHAMQVRYQLRHSPSSCGNQKHSGGAPPSQNRLAVVTECRLRERSGVVLDQSPEARNRPLNQHAPGTVGEHPKCRPVLARQAQ